MKVLDFTCGLQLQGRSAMFPVTQNPLYKRSIVFRVQMLPTCLHIASQYLGFIHHYLVLAFSSTFFNTILLSCDGF